MERPNSNSDQANTETKLRIKAVAVDVKTGEQTIILPDTPKMDELLKSMAKQPGEFD